jgi:hypothetical protein
VLHDGEEEHGLGGRGLFLGRGSGRHDAFGCSKVFGEAFKGKVVLGEGKRLVVSTMLSRSDSMLESLEPSE